jgi:hypothetical protein
MGFWKAAVSGCAGILMGLAVGYTVWGQPMANLHGSLAKVTAELATTKVWLWDEIRSSDERYDRVSSSLARTVADLAQARAELARIRTLPAQGSTPGTLASGEPRPAP